MSPSLTSSKAISKFTRKSYPTGITLKEALVCTLCWNSFEYERFVHQVPTDHPIYKIPLDTYEENAIDSEVEVLVENASQRTEGQLLALTNKGHLAMVSEMTQSGDIIAILSGASVLFVLRPDGGQFLLIGPCYVHDIMDEEAVSTDRSEFRVFELH
jgi:hypothetical protein